MEPISSPLNPEQELAFIRKVITDSRQAFVEDGKPYIVWGIVVALGMMITYICALVQQDFYTGWLWIGLTVIGIAYTLVETRKAKKRERERASNFVDRMQGAIWGACGTALGMTILLIMIGYSMNTDSVHPIFTCSLVSIILGIAYFLSGFVLQIKWLRNISIAWWLGAIVMFFLHSVHVLGMYAGMIIVFQVVPGIVLNRKYQESLKTSPSLTHA